MMRKAAPALTALLLTACTADDTDSSGPRQDGATGEPVMIEDVAVENDAIEDVTVKNDAIEDVAVRDDDRRETGLICPVHSDACPPECSPVLGYRVDRIRYCFSPMQVISCVDRTKGSMPALSCLVRSDNELFKTDEIYDGLDRAAWRQCDMSDSDFAIAWRATPCDQDAP